MRKPTDIDFVEPPKAARRPISRTIHGQDLVDDYAWLRAENWREVLKDPAQLPSEIHDHLKAENAYTEAIVAPLENLRGRLSAELRGRIKEDDAQVPFPDGPFDYYARFRAGGQHELICRRRRDGGEEELLLDGDLLAEGKPFFALHAAEHSSDHRLLAWSCDDKGSELFCIRVRNLDDGRDLDDCIERTDGTIVWAQDASAFYYVRVDENHRTAQVFRHRLGTAQSSDQCVVEDLDPGWFVHLRRSRSGRFGVVAMSDHDSSETWLIDLADAAAPARLVAARTPKLRYDVDHFDDRLFIRTNAAGAEDFKIVETPLDRPERAHWRDIEPARAGRMIVETTVFARYLVRLERENALPRIVVRDLTSGEEHAIEFSEEAYALRLEEGLEFDTPILRFVYSSMATPETTYDYNMATRERILRKRQEIPSGHDPARYVVRRILVEAADGETIPVSLLARADRQGAAPCLLYGYGAYGYALSAGFNANRFSLVDRGFIYAIAHVRGGADKGWAWYENGKLDKKPNSFADFIAAAHGLVARGLTRAGQIVAQGGSAGGMLMGAVANQAPELFAGVIADVPFVDVVNTMLDKDLPLTPPEWLEWGDPIENAAAFRNMLSYSPYDNVGAKIYPAILALGGLTDPRVTYWEPAKWVARLRAHMTGGGPVLLRTNMDAGHGGASGRFDRLEEIALQQAFALTAAAEGFNAAGRDSGDS